jgi:D-alanyl-D-alanine carboxypeptidase
MTRMRAVAVPAVLAAALALAGAGCGGNPAAPAAPTTPATSSPRPAVTQTQPAQAVAPSAVPSRHHQHPQVFTAKVSGALDRSQVRYSWHPGCPVGPSALRMITMTYRGFDHKVHTGRMVVNAEVTGKLILVFRKLFEMRFPIRRMVPVDAYHGSDFASIQADNTSSFNCRDATGSSTWSEHAYGLAVDLDPCENPYVYANGYEAHKRCRKYVDRSLQDPGIIHAGDQAVRAFASVGWGWGGIWPGDRDYQHFSANGR